MMKLHSEHSAKLSYLNGKPKIFIECIENQNYRGAIATLKGMKPYERDQVPYDLIKFISALCAVYNLDHAW